MTGTRLHHRSIEEYGSAVLSQRSAVYSDLVRTYHGRNMASKKAYSSLLNNSDTNGIFNLNFACQIVKYKDCAVHEWSLGGGGFL